MQNKEYKFFMGSSMLPAIQTGAKLKIKEVIPKDIKIGDIVIFKSAKLTCHRIVGKYKIGNLLYFLEKGDNRGFGFNSVSAEAIIGRVVEIETLERKILKGKSINLSDFKVMKYEVFSAIYGFLHAVKLFFFKKRRNIFIKSMCTFLERIYR